MRATPNPVLADLPTPGCARAVGATENDIFRASGLRHTQKFARFQQNEKVVQMI
jgi:hypothetical protein